MKRIVATVTLACLTASSVLAQRPDAHTRIAAYLDSTAAEWLAVRRDLHQHPEVSGQEVRTAQVVADRLTPGIRHICGHDVHVTIGLALAAAFASAKADVVSVVGAQAFFDLQAPPQGFSEDFGAFQAEVPGVFFFLGVGNAAKGIAAMPHSPNFVVDESAIPFGVKAMAAAVIGRLRKD